MVVVPPFTVKLPSALMPLPPAPVLVSVSVPPLMVTLPSAPKQAAALVLLLSLSHVPPPLVVIVMAPSLILMSPSDLMPLAASAVTAMLMVPPSR